MINIVVEVVDGGALFREAVTAESIRRALETERCMHPGGNVKVIFPITPESFFVEEDPGAPRSRPDRRSGPHPLRHARERVAL